MKDYCSSYLADNLIIVCFYSFPTPNSITTVKQAVLKWHCRLTNVLLYYEAMKGEEQREYQEGL